MANEDTICYGVNLEGEPIMGPAVKLELKFHAAKELAQYLEPKLKAVEHSMDPDKPLHVTIRRAH